ncbi:MAG: hypothetical protein A4E72_01190 [Syntrophus sp. PtaU1.Bin208]|nr:MAG: hypothetical protein A4E72_01190 [Syntrophus sp. PtaU1.Bin208]
MVVTARKENLNANDVGAAYVFLHKGNQWIFSEKLTASDPLAGAYFGQSVAIQGNLLAIGARNADSAGAVYLFHRTGKGWKEFAKVNPPDGLDDDQFGFSVALSENVLMVGARRADPDGLTDAGAAYVYALNGNSVDLMTKLTASDVAAGDQFGQSVAMVGKVIAVGANRAKIGANEKQGAVYLFHREDNSWTERKKVTASDGLKGDEFGYSLSAFGNEFVTGAHFADSNVGAAYVIPLKP